jgi:hypothetical protein
MKTQQGCQGCRWNGKPASESASLRPAHVQCCCILSMHAALLAGAFHISQRCNYGCGLLWVSATSTALAAPEPCVVGPPAGGDQQAASSSDCC